MRHIVIATVIFVAAIGSAFAQAPSCPNGQAYDQTQKKCVSSSAKSSSGY
jgi:hypothetical protein